MKGIVTLTMNAKQTLSVTVRQCAKYDVLTAVILVVPFASILKQSIGLNILLQNAHHKN